jgi:D-xylose transport system permease protein
MADVRPAARSTASDDATPSWRALLSSTEIDTRLFGMVLALAVIWLGFHVLSGGDFLTARNLWNLSVQSASIAIMATGMVLIIVSRNIDLSVGAVLGFLGYVMAMVQTEWIPNTFDLGLDRWYTWIVALVVGVVLGAAVGGVQGYVVAYVGVPAFIVTLGGFLVWRGLIFRFKQGQTLAPLDDAFQLMGGGARGSLGEWKSWLLALIGCVGIALSLSLARRRRSRFDLTARPVGVDIATTWPSARCGLTSGWASSGARP